MKNLSIEDRKRLFIENACSSCGGSSDGGGDEGGGAGNSDGTDENYDSLLKGLALLKKKKKSKKKDVVESKKELPVKNMILKASQLEGKANEEKDREKKFPLYDRVRKIKSQIK